MMNVQDEYDAIQKNKTLLEEKEKQSKQLLNQTKLATIGELLGNIAHQWKQPLNTLNMLISSAKMFSTEPRKDEKLTQEYLNKALEQIQYLSETVSNFNKFFISQDLKEIDFKLVDFFKNIETFTLTQFRSLDIKLFFNIKDIIIFGNQNQLTQVILNILNNAKDVLEEKNNVKERLILVETSQNDNATIISIKDNAGGIENSIKKLYF